MDVLNNQTKQENPNALTKIRNFCTYLARKSEPKTPPSETRKTHSCLSTSWLKVRTSNISGFYRFAQLKTKVAVVVLIERVVPHPSEAWHGVGSLVGCDHILRQRRRVDHCALSRLCETVEKDWERRPSQSIGLTNPRPGKTPGNFRRWELGLLRERTGG